MGRCREAPGHHSLAGPPLALPHPTATTRPPKQQTEYLLTSDPLPVIKRFSAPTHVHQSSLRGPVQCTTKQKFDLIATLELGSRKKGVGSGTPHLLEISTVPFGCCSSCLRENEDRIA